jgi:hypothetical protein
MAAMNRVIVVVGMHRSGTSAMVRALGYLGADLGETFIDVIPEVNAKGFWEDADLNRINIAVLRHIGFDWLSNRPIPEACFADPGLQPLLAQGVDLLRVKTRNHDIFAFKDPRTTLLLPFWTRVFAQLDVTPGYLVAIRHPAAVAASLAKRNGFNKAKSHLLWLHYTVEAMQKSAMAGRLLVDYDQLMDRPVESLRRIARHLDLSPPSAADETEFCSQFLSPELRHCQPTKAAAPTTDPTQALYDALLPAARDEADLDGDAVARALTQAAAYLAAASPLLAYLDDVEQAAALGPVATDDRFPWLPTLRSSFGVSAPETGASQEAKPSRLAGLFSRLRGRAA